MRVNWTVDSRHAIGSNLQRTRSKFKHYSTLSRRRRRTVARSWRQSGRTEWAPATIVYVQSTSNCGADDEIELHIGAGTKSWPPARKKNGRQNIVLLHTDFVASLPQLYLNLKGSTTFARVPSSSFVSDELGTLANVVLHFRLFAWKWAFSNSCVVAVIAATSCP